MKDLARLRREKDRAFEEWQGYQGDLIEHLEVRPSERGPEWESRLVEIEGSKHLAAGEYDALALAVQRHEQSEAAAAAAEPNAQLPPLTGSDWLPEELRGGVLTPPSLRPLTIDDVPDLDTIPFPDIPPETGGEADGPANAWELDAPAQTDPGSTPPASIHDELKDANERLRRDRAARPPDTRGPVLAAVGVVALILIGIGAAQAMRATAAVPAATIAATAAPATAAVVPTATPAATARPATHPVGVAYAFGPSGSERCAPPYMAPKLAGFYTETTTIADGTSTTRRVELAGGTLAGEIQIFRYDPQSREPIGSPERVVPFSVVLQGAETQLERVIVPWERMSRIVVTSWNGQPARANGLPNLFVPACS